VQQNGDLSIGAVLGAAFLSFLFGANVAAMKISLAGLGAFTTAAIRFAAAAAAIALWAAATGRRYSVPRAYRLQLAILCVGFTCQLTLFYLGISKTHASRGALMANMQPFFVLLLAHLFITDDRMTVRKAVGILLGFVGVVFVFLEKTGISAEFQTGDLVILGAAFLWAGNAVYTKTIIDHFAPFHLVMYPMIFSAPIFLVQGLIWDEKMIGSLDGRIVAAVAYQSMTASFGFVAWNSMLKRHGAVALHSFIFIMPIAGVLLGGLVLHEPITGNILAAMGFIVAGILTIHFRQPSHITSVPSDRSL
jgi:drug/metabolite transporter (DMT)-like permease